MGNEIEYRRLQQTWQGPCFQITRNSEPSQVNRKKDKMNKMKYLATLLIGIAGLGFQQAQAATFDFQNSMHWSTNDTYLIGTVIPGLTGNGGQAARDAAMTNTLLNMAAPFRRELGRHERPFVFAHYVGYHWLSGRDGCRR